MDEIPVTLSISDGKISAESTSGPKSGSIDLAVEGTSVTLELGGASSDQASATLTGPELANFRTMIDAALSKLTVGEEPAPTGRHVLFSGYLPLRKDDDEIVIQFDEEPLRRLDITDEEGSIAGGGRQVQCTVLGNGTAILNLKSDERTDDSQAVKDRF